MESASGHGVARNSDVMSGDVAGALRDTTRRETLERAKHQMQNFLIYSTNISYQMRGGCPSIYRGEGGGMASYDFAPRVCSRAYNCAKGFLVFFPLPFPDIFISGIFLLFIIWYTSTIHHLVYFHYSWMMRPGAAPGCFVRATRPGDASVG